MSNHLSWSSILQNLVVIKNENIKQKYSFVHLEINDLYNLFIILKTQIIFSAAETKDYFHKYLIWYWPFLSLCKLNKEKQPILLTVQWKPKFLKTQ